MQHSAINLPDIRQWHSEQGHR